MLSSPSRIREELRWADKWIDRRGDRDAAIGRSNRIRHRFNEYAWANATIAFEVRDRNLKSANVPAEVEVLPFDDGRYCVRVMGNLPDSGFASPFDPSALYESNRAAARAGTERVLAWTLDALRCASQSNVRVEATRIIEACRKFLDGHQQATLF